MANTTCRSRTPHETPGLNWECCLPAGHPGNHKAKAYGTTVKSWPRKDKNRKGSR